MIDEHEHTWKPKGHYNFGDPIGRALRVRCDCGQVGYRRPEYRNAHTGEPSMVVFTWCQADAVDD